LKPIIKFSFFLPKPSFLFFIDGFE
jgi:hypothetical protein